MIHDREYFYKYVTVETALKILQNRSLKYSSPTTFNDPFDTQTRMNFGFETSDLLKEFKDELYSLIHDTKEPVGDKANPLFQSIKTVWHTAKQSSKKMPKDIWQKLTSPLVEETVKVLDQNIEEMNSWWERMSKASKVFCLAEDHTNLLMWAHYAKEHTGAVIKFKCLPGLDTPLCAARKVYYSDKPPVIAELKEYIKNITGYATAPASYTTFYKMFLTKSNHWKYEQEWRVFIPTCNVKSPTIPVDEDGKELLFDFIQFYPQEIHSIYFGCKMTEHNSQEIQKYLNGDFAHVKKYKCIRNEKEYKLDFEEVV